MDPLFEANPYRNEEFRRKKEEEIRGRSIYRFKYPYYEEYLEYINDLSDIFHENKSNIDETIVIKMPIYEQAFPKNIFYYIIAKNGKITYNELFRQIDEQSIDYLTDLCNEDKTCIDGFKKINSITYLMECGS